MYIAIDPLPNKPWLCKHEATVQASSICRLQTLSNWTRSVFSSLVNSLKHYIFMNCVQMIKKNCYQTSINIKPNISCTYHYLPNKYWLCNIEECETFLPQSFPHNQFLAFQLPHSYRLQIFPI